MSKSIDALLMVYGLGYRISECGTELQTPTKLIKQERKSSTGYPVFSIRFAGTVIPIQWHRLQAYQKYGEKLFEKGIVVRHLNSIKTDCSWDNILIGTQKDNVYDNPKEKLLKNSINATSTFWIKKEIKWFNFTVSSTVFGDYEMDDTYGKLGDMPFFNKKSAEKRMKILKQ